jgi:hypothetical protein
LVKVTARVATALAGTAPLRDLRQLWTTRLAADIVIETGEADSLAAGWSDR